MFQVIYIQFGFTDTMVTETQSTDNSRGMELELTCKPSNEMNMVDGGWDGEPHHLH